MGSSIRQVVKHALSRLGGRPIALVDRSIVDECEVVSFDVFDTLVVRACQSPTDVFDIVERRYNHQHPERPIAAFKESRIGAEQDARAHTANEEVTLEEIYEMLASRLGSACETLMQLEQETEIVICRANPELKAFYDALLEAGKRIVIISDMYLTAATVEAILATCGYGGYERLYVSSAAGKTKASGSLFDHVCADLGVAPAAVMHVGDNPRADFLVPRRRGMRSFLYRNATPFPRLYRWRHHADVVLNDDDRLTLNVLGSMARHSGCATWDLHCRIGYEVLGPLLAGYSTWLNGLIRKERPSSVFFLSREGCILMRAYEALTPNPGASVHYVNVSRLAACRANAVGAHDYEDLRALFSSLLRGCTSIGDLFSLLGRVPDDEELGAYDLSLDQGLEDVDKASLFNAVQRCCGAYFERQHRYAREYLVRRGIEGEKVILSDIGWSGTMQVMLQRLFPNANLVGAYLAVSDFMKHDEYARLARHGYWCDGAGWGDRGQAIRFTESAIETLFLSTEGSTLEYRRDANGEIEAVRESGETSEPICRAISEVEDGALRFVEDFSALADVLAVAPLKSDPFFVPYLNFCVYPHAEAVRFFGRFRFEDGVYEVGFLPRRTLGHYLVHPRDAFDELNLNASKILWLKALLRLPLPYYKMLRFLTSRMGMKSAHERQVGGIGSEA